VTGTPAGNDADRPPTIAIVGSGVSGLTVASGLYNNAEITIFEAEDWIGGHTHTVDVEEDGRNIAIDTGFIVCNDWTYPTFLDLLRTLDVQTQPSNMSFSLQDEVTGLEYNGTSLNTLFAQRRNLLSASFLQMLADIVRFNREASRYLRRANDATTLGQWVTAHKYSRAFVDRYLVPMGRAIWSASEDAILGFPARFFIDFFARHGFLSVNDRPQWRTVVGGSREYVRALTKPFSTRIRTRTAIDWIARSNDGVVLRTRAGEVLAYDAVVIACHADTALHLLSDPSEDERDILRQFPFQSNEAVLHTDTRLLPHAPLARAAWNYHLRKDPHTGCAITYDMNVLQSIESGRRYLVSLNLTDRIDPAAILGRFQYAHPIYTPSGVAAQRRHGDISGRRNTFYCGAYWRYGFHEDGVVSGTTVLTQISRWRKARVERAVRRDG
jgi:predicted NAD/FAD-binding protein